MSFKPEDLAIVTGVKPPHHHLNGQIVTITGELMFWRVAGQGLLQGHAASNWDIRRLFPGIGYSVFALNCLRPLADVNALAVSPLQELMQDKYLANVKAAAAAERKGPHAPR